MPVSLNNKGQVRTQVNAREIAEGIVGEVRTDVMRQARELARSLYTGEMDAAREIYAGAPSAPDEMLGRLAGRIGQGAAAGVNVTVANGNITVSTGGGGNSHYATWIEGGTRAPDPMNFINNARKRRATKTALVRSTTGTYYYTRATLVGLRQRNGSLAKIVRPVGSNYLIVSNNEDATVAGLGVSPMQVPTYAAEAFQAAPVGSYRTGFAGDNAGVFEGAGKDDRIIENNIDGLMFKYRSALSKQGGGKRRGADAKEMRSLKDAVKRAKAEYEKQTQLASFERFRTSRVKDGSANAFYTNAPLDRGEKRELKSLDGELGRATRSLESLTAGVEHAKSLQEMLRYNLTADMPRAWDESELDYEKEKEKHRRSTSRTYVDRDKQLQGAPAALARRQELIDGITARFAALKAKEVSDSAPRRSIKRITRGGKSEYRSFVTLSTSAIGKDGHGTLPRIGKAMPAYPVMSIVQRFLDEKLRELEAAAKGS